jgi:streptomycin 6-kinase
MTLLLRRVRPGTALDGLDYDEQLVVAGELVARLHAAGEPSPALPSVGAYVDPYRQLGDPELDVLLASGDDDPVAVHADLHGGNVLRDGDRWVAIDPKGVRGDRHLDVWLLVCPQAPALPDDAASEMRRRIETYSRAAGLDPERAAGLDPERAAAWARVIARAEAVLCGESAFAGWPARLRRIAEALD